MRKLVFVLTQVFLSVLLFAQSLPEPLVFVTEIWPPFRIESTTPGGPVTGIDIEIIELLSQELNRPIQVQRHPFARALEMIRTGDADIISGIAYTPQRDDYIVYLEPSYAEVYPAFITGRGQGSGIVEYDDLYGKRIGYSLHSAYFEPFNSDSRLTKVGVSTEEQLLQMVALERFDVIIGTEPNLSYDIARLGLSGTLERTLYTPPTTTPLYLGISEHSSLYQEVDRIEQILQRLLTDGTIDRILEGYR